MLKVSSEDIWSVVWDWMAEEERESALDFGVARRVTHLLIFRYFLVDRSARQSPCMIIVSTLRLSNHLPTA